MLELFEKLNEKQKRLAIAYIRALLGGRESEDERKIASLQRFQNLNSYHLVNSKKQKFSWKTAKKEEKKNA